MVGWMEGQSACNYPAMQCIAACRTQSYSGRLLTKSRGYGLTFRAAAPLKLCYCVRIESFFFSAVTTTAVDPVNHAYHCHSWGPVGYVLSLAEICPSSAPSRCRIHLIILTRTCTGDEGVSIRGEPNTADHTQY